MSADSELIFENYERFLTEHRDDIGSPSGAIEMLSSDGAFHSYVNALTEGLEASVKTNVLAVCERQREVLLEESVNIGPTASAIGYAVSYFPILTDIYSDPILNKVATIFPTSKSMITLPKSIVKASVKNIDGTTDTYTIPRSTLLARQKKIIVTMLPNTSNDMFALSGGLNPDEVRVNKRYFIVTNLVVAKAGVNTIVPMLIRPDARGQLNKDFSYDDAGVTITGKLIGNVDWDKGRVQYSVTYSDGAVTTVSIDADTIFSARTSDIGRVKVSVEMSGFDVNIDVKDDFEIELETETVQDYKDLFWSPMLAIA